MFEGKARDKHSSLLRKSENYVRKKFFKRSSLSHFSENGSETAKEED